MWWLVTAAVLVSVVHYSDNYLNYEDYPVPSVNSQVPAPAAQVVGISWFAFTAAGAAGALLWQRRRITAAAVALTGYSVSGLVGLAHYSAPRATEMVWWRQAHIVADVLCGAAVLTFALWAVLRSRELSDDHPSGGSRLTSARGGRHRVAR